MEEPARRGSAVHDRTYENYMRDVEDYLRKVRNGRRVAKADSQAPRFSQQADDARVAQRMGIAEHVPQVPPMYSAPRGQDPVGYGFTNSYQPPPVQKWIGDNILQPLTDERVGMAFPGIGGVSKFGRWREFLRRPHTPDTGGFNVSTYDMNKMPTIEAMRNVGTEERHRRSQYLDEIIGMNNYVRDFNPRDPLQVQALMQLEHVNPELSNSIAKTATGKWELEKLRTQAFDPAMESNPPLQVRRMFGFKKGE